MQDLFFKRRCTGLYYQVTSLKGDYLDETCPSLKGLSFKPMIFIDNHKTGLLELQPHVREQLNFEVANLKKIIARNNMTYEGTDPVEDAATLKKSQMILKFYKE